MCGVTLPMIRFRGAMNSLIFTMLMQLSVAMTWSVSRMVLGTSCVGRL